MTNTSETQPSGGAAWELGRASERMAHAVLSGDALNYAIPRAWLSRQAQLGPCVVAETYAASGNYSLAEFQGGVVIYLKARNVALVELF